VCGVRLKNNDAGGVVGGLSLRRRFSKRGQHREVRLTGFKAYFNIGYVQLA
jgi:hypothetical protein